MGREAQEAAFRAHEIRYLIDATRQLRTFYRGFEARDGYALKPVTVARLSNAQRDRITKMAKHLRRELASAHVIVRPRTTKSARALDKHTGSKPSARRKAYVVHVEKPESTRIRIQRGKKKSSPAHIQEVRKIKGGRFEARYFYFADYAKRMPVTMDGILKVAKRMIVDMPLGFYVMLSNEHGFIGTPMHKNLLLKQLVDEWSQYEKYGTGTGLARSLIGFRMVSTTEDGARREYRERLTLRGHMQQLRDRAKSRLRDKLKRRRNRGR